MFCFDLWLICLCTTYNFAESCPTLFSASCLIQVFTHPHIPSDFCFRVSTTSSLLNVDLVLRELLANWEIYNTIIDSPAGHLVPSPQRYAYPFQHYYNCVQAYHHGYHNPLILLFMRISLSMTQATPIDFQIRTYHPFQPMCSFRPPRQHYKAVALLGHENMAMATKHGPHELSVVGLVFPSATKCTTGAHDMVCIRPIWFFFRRFDHFWLHLWLSHFLHIVITRPIGLPQGLTLSKYSRGGFHPVFHAPQWEGIYIQPDQWPGVRHGQSLLWKIGPY